MPIEVGFYISRFGPFEAYKTIKLLTLQEYAMQKNINIYSGTLDLRKGMNRLEMQGTRRVHRGT